MTYKIFYRKRFFWKRILVVGHRLDKELNRMDFYIPDGSIMSLTKWDRYDMKLGIDWVLFTKKQMEKESGQQIPLNV
jgi:hypothetical protein